MAATRGDRGGGGAQVNLGSADGFVSPAAAGQGEIGREGQPEEDYPHLSRRGQCDELRSPEMAEAGRRTAHKPGWSASSQLRQIAD
jgi:hypothetical protein